MIICRLDFFGVVGDHCFACARRRNNTQKVLLICDGDRRLGALCGKCSKLPAAALPEQIRTGLDAQIVKFGRYAGVSPAYAKFVEKLQGYRRLAEGEITIEEGAPAGVGVRSSSQME